MTARMKFGHVLLRWSLVAILVSLGLMCAVFTKTYSEGGLPQTAQRTSAPAESTQPESELRVGIDLTRQGKFAEAIPHFLAARGHVSAGYAADFKLALCYVGTSEFDQPSSVLR